MLPNVPNITSCAKIAGGSSVVKPTFPTIPGFGTTSGIIIGQGDITGSKKATCDNRRWYGSKELTTDHGLNTYDFEARWLAPAFPRFTTVEMVLPEDNNLEIAGHEFKHGYQFEIGKYGFTKMSSQILIYDHTDEIKAYNRSASITGLDYSDILNGETYAHLNRNPYSVRTLLEPIKEYLNNELVIERFARQKKTIFRWNGRTYIGF